MMPTLKSRRSRIDSCISDLTENGIDVRAPDNRRRLGAFVREHLDYFQLMLGYDSNAAEVLQLLKDRAAAAAASAR